MTMPSMYQGRDDLKMLDRKLLKSGTYQAEPQQQSSALPKRPLKTLQPPLGEFSSDIGELDLQPMPVEKPILSLPERYKDYLRRADPLIQQIIGVEARFEDNPKGLTIQQLGSMTQQLQFEWTHFAKHCQPSEESYDSYQKIASAVEDLNAVWDYWKLSEGYRERFRPGRWAEQDDDTVIRNRLLSAQKAIEQLKVLQSLRAAVEPVKDAAEESLPSPGE